MPLLFSVIGWLASVFFALAAYALYSMGGRWQALLLLVACLVFLPPLRSSLGQATGWALPWWGRGLATVVLLAGVVAVTVLNPATSIYKSPAVEARFHQLYDAKLAKWPVPHDDVFVDTGYGRIHVIVSGPQGAPPVVLINASAVAAWSWITNVAALAADHRVYAIDNIGEVGKNVQSDINDIPRTGSQIAAYYGEIANKLAIGRADVVGASVGGYIATMLALHAPERVHKLVLLGPMGYGDTGRTILIMTLAQAFPLKPVQTWALNWALGDSARVAQEFGDWFRLVLNGSVPNPIPPHSLAADELKDIAAPTLVFFGTKDRVVGDADKAAALARNIPDVRVEIVDSGHLIGAEVPEVVNPKIAAFLAE